MNLANLYITKQRKITIYSILLYWVSYIILNLIFYDDYGKFRDYFLFFIMIIVVVSFFLNIFFFYLIIPKKQDRLSFLDKIFPLKYIFPSSNFIEVQVALYFFLPFMIMSYIIAFVDKTFYADMKFYQYIILSLWVYMSVLAPTYVYLHLVYLMTRRKK